MTSQVKSRQVKSSQDKTRQGEEESQTHHTHADNFAEAHAILSKLIPPFPRILHSTCSMNFLKALAEPSKRRNTKYQKTVRHDRTRQYDTIQYYIRQYNTIPYIKKTKHIIVRLIIKCLK